MHMATISRGSFSALGERGGSKITQKLAKSPKKLEQFRKIWEIAKNARFSLIFTRKNLNYNWFLGRKFNEEFPRISVFTFGANKFPFFSPSKITERVTLESSKMCRKQNCSLLRSIKAFAHVTHAKTKGVHAKVRKKTNFCDNFPVLLQNASSERS